MLVESRENEEFSTEIIVEAKPFVVVGIPAFNEELSIARVVLEAKKHADVVVVCDDGSTDLTRKIAACLGADVIRHERNMGYGAALESLFRRARDFSADVLITLDADGQHEPKEIPILAAPIIEGSADLVVGSRFVEGSEIADMPAYRRFGAKVITRLVSGLKKNVSDAQSGFRAYSREAMKRLSISEFGMGASVELLLDARKLGLKVCEVSCSCKYNNNGRVATSKKHPLRQGLGVVMSILRLVVEERPLVFLGLPGLISLVLGAAFGVWMLQLYALNHAIVTNIALASIAFLLLGFFMLSTAITLYAISRLAKRMDGTR
jgi:glycosyltransferase involved in cell wall biosynthesis